MISLKKRLDILLFEKNLTESREKAKTLIMAGLVYVDSQKSDKPGEMINENADLEVRGKPIPYVSRGGLKLEKAIAEFGIDLSEKVCMDIGASTGGFTDCMLQNGAIRVYSVDVGYGQLAWKLRNDERVVNLERTNARYLSREEIPQEIDLTSIDVSFISLSKILPAVRRLLRDAGSALCLIKPQFEAGREKVGKKGVVREPETHTQVIQKVIAESVEIGFSVCSLTYSPVRGPEGNIEYLVLLKKSDEPKNQFTNAKIKEIVCESHKELGG